MRQSCGFASAKMEGRLTAEGGDDGNHNNDGDQGLFGDADCTRAVARGTSLAINGMICGPGVFLTARTITVIVIFGGEREIVRCLGCHDVSARCEDKGVRLGCLYDTVTRGRLVDGLVEQFAQQTPYDKVDRWNDTRCKRERPSCRYIQSKVFCSSRRLIQMFFNQASQPHVCHAVTRCP